MIGVVLGVNCLKFFASKAIKKECVSQEVGVVCRVPAKNNLGTKNRQQAIIRN